MSETPDIDPQEGFDAQDAAEAFDETTLDGQSQRGEMRTFEELPELLDVTQADGDRDDDEALALDADEFDPEAMDDNDTEEDHELDYRAATEEREDDLDGQGPESGFNEDRHPATDIEGLGNVRDAESVEDGEDDFTNFEAKGVSDAELDELGYADNGPGGARARPNHPG